MIEQFHQFAAKEILFSKSHRILIAVSGGKDSMVLLHLLHSSGLKVAVGHINYQLRGEDSDQDEQLIIQEAKRLNIPVHVKKVIINKDRVNIQEEARDIRYSFFQELCDEHGYDKIATAHHANDSLETLFIQLIRGTGIHGMKGIPTKRDNIVRPLLFASREQIDTYAHEHQVPYRNDVSNESDGYLRNRIRHHLIPLIDQEIDPTAIKKLHTSIELLTEDAEAVKSLADSLLNKKGLEFTLDLNQVPNPSAATWVYHAISKFGFNRDQAKSITSATENGKLIRNQDFICTKIGHELVIKSGHSEFETIKIPSLGKYELNGNTLLVEKSTIDEIDLTVFKNSAKNDSAIFDFDKITFPLSLELANGFDSMQPLGSQNQVKLKKLTSDKSDLIVLKDQAGLIIWLFNQRISEKVKVDDSTQHVLNVYLKSI